MEFRGRLTRIQLLGFGQRLSRTVFGKLAATITLAGRLDRSPDVFARFGRIDRSGQGCRCARRSDRPKRRTVALRASVSSDRSARARGRPPIRAVPAAQADPAPDTKTGYPPGRDAAAAAAKNCRRSRPGRADVLTSRSHRDVSSHETRRPRSRWGIREVPPDSLPALRRRSEPLATRSSPWTSSVSDH